jgi:hypothetical protein
MLPVLAGGEDHGNATIDRLGSGIVDEPAMPIELIPVNGRCDQAGGAAVEGAARA